MKDKAALTGRRLALASPPWNHRDEDPKSVRRIFESKPDIGRVQDLWDWTVSMHQHAPRAPTETAAELASGKRLPKGRRDRSKDPIDLLTLKSTRLRLRDALKRLITQQDQVLSGGCFWERVENGHARSHLLGF